MSKTIRRDHYVLPDSFDNDNFLDSYIENAYQKTYHEQIQREQAMWARRRAARANDDTVS